MVCPRLNRENKKFLSGLGRQTECIDPAHYENSNGAMKPLPRCPRCCARLGLRWSRLTSHGACPNYSGMQSAGASSEEPAARTRVFPRSVTCVSLCQNVGAPLEICYAKHLQQFYGRLFWGLGSMSTSDASSSRTDQSLPSLTDQAAAGCWPRKYALKHPRLE
jgi:hypothetical protein